MYQQSTRTARKHTLVRIVLVCVVFVSAVLVYPLATLGIALVALMRHGAYETIFAGLVLDALLAPGTGVLGDFTYTVSLLGGALGAFLVRRVVRGGRADTP